MQLHYSVEDVPLGTAGSVKQAQHLLDDTFLVISGDALTDFDLGALIHYHRAKKSVATITLTHVPDPLEYGVVITESSGRIRRFLEKPSWGEVISDTINTGIYVLEPEALRRFEKGQPFDFSKDLFPQLLSEGARIVGPTTIRSYGVVDAYASIDRSIVWRNSYVGDHAEVHGSIVGRQCSLKSRVMLEDGSVIGDHSVVGEGARVRAGVKVWPDKQIEAGAVLSSSLIWGAQGRRALFGRFGVTGLVNIDLTAQFAARLGAAWGSALPQGSTVTMNRDQHRASRMLKRALMGGIVGSGVHVADLLEVPIPLGRFHPRRTRVAGGANIRISPFDDRVVDIKFYDGQALDIGKAVERRIEQSFFREDFRSVPVTDIGRIYNATRVGEAYAEAFLAMIKRRREIEDARFKIVVNYSQGTSSLHLPQLLDTLGCDVIAINATVSETVGRSFEMFQSQMRELAAITATLRAHFGVSIDAGGEKVFFVDERGRVINDVTFLAIMSKLVIADAPGAMGSGPVDSPQVLETAAEDVGGRVQRTRASAEALMQVAQRDTPALVADGRGGFIWPAFHASFDGLLTVSKLLELLAVSGRPLSGFVDAAPEVHMARLKVDCPWDEKGRVMRLLAEEPRTA